MRRQTSKVDSQANVTDFFPLNPAFYMDEYTVLERQNTRLCPS